MTIRLYSFRGSVGRRRFPRWQSFGLGEGTTDSLLRYLDEETHRQRVYTQPGARWAQTPLPPDANGHLPAQNGHRWVHLIPHPARETERSSSKLGFATAASPGRDPSARKLGSVGPRGYWLLGRRLSPGEQGQASFTPATTRRRCPTKVKPKARRESQGHGRSSKARACTPLARWSLPGCERCLSGWPRPLRALASAWSAIYIERRLQAPHRRLPVDPTA